jgi:Uma2 family endonuclease
MASEPVVGNPATPFASPPAAPLDYDAIDYDAIVTEDDTPVDNIYSEKQQRLLTEPLYSSWPGPGDGRPFVASANVGVFYEPRLPPLVPDAYLSVDVKIPGDIRLKKNRSYFIWRYGKPPDVVIEVVSNTEGGELGRKIEIYARMGVPHYVAWDPAQILGDDRLHVFELDGGVYQRRASAWFLKANLGLAIWNGVFEEWTVDWLRWCDAAGKVIPTGAEGRQQAEQRADQAQHRADEAQHRAEKAEQELTKARQRAEKLAALLRSQGLQPPENGQ